MHVPSFIWSGAFPSRVRGAVVDDLFHAVDWLPTLLGAVSPAYLKKDIHASTVDGDLDGLDLHEAFILGKTTRGRARRTEMLLRMNRWQGAPGLNQLSTETFDASNMGLIHQEGGRTYVRANRCSVPPRAE